MLLLSLHLIRHGPEWLATAPGLTSFTGRGDTMEAAIDDLWQISPVLKPAERPSSFLIMLAELGQPDPEPEPWPRIAAGRPEPFLAPEYQPPHE